MRGPEGPAMLTPETVSNAAHVPHPVDVDSTQKLELSIRRILLCTDFSAAADAAVVQACAIWRRTGAHITVLHVCEYGPIPAPTDEGLEYVERLYAEQRRLLRETLERVRATGADADSLLLDGNAPSVILEQVHWQKADIVVLGTRATHGMERLVFGSTAEAVFRRARCPVVTVNCSHVAAERDASDGPVVFATDFKEDASEALQFAIAYANTCRAPLHCVHVLPLSARETKELILENIMRQALHRLTQRDAMCNCPPVRQIVYGSDIPHAIVEYAALSHAQLIVLGVRRRSRLAAHLPPHRTYRVITTAPCAVVTISSEQPSAAAVAAACV